MLRRREPDAPRPYKVPGYPFVPWVFVIFSLLYLGFTVYNDIGLYRAAVAEGKPAMINSVFGTALVLVTHDPSLAACADRVVSLRDGRIVFEGTPEQLVAARSTLTGEHLAAYVRGHENRERTR